MLSIIFDDDCITRKSMVRPSMPSVGDKCSIRWSDSVEYTCDSFRHG